MVCRNGKQDRRVIGPDNVKRYCRRKPGSSCCNKLKQAHATWQKGDAIQGRSHNIPRAKGVPSLPPSPSHAFPRSLLPAPLPSLPSHHGRGARDPRPTACTTTKTKLTLCRGSATLALAGGRRLRRARSSCPGWGRAISEHR